MAAICGVLKTVIIVGGVVEIVRMLLLSAMINNGDVDLESGMFERYWFKKRNKDGWQK